MPPLPALLWPVATTVGADQVEDGREHVRASAGRGIAVPAVAADAGHLMRGLIDHHVVGLLGVGTGIVSGHRDVDRIVKREGRVNEAAIGVSVATVAGAVVTGTGRAREDAGTGPNALTFPPDAALPLPPSPPMPAICVAD